jgi:hypothetical protein
MVRTEQKGINTSSMGAVIRNGTTKKKETIFLVLGNLELNVYCYSQDVAGFIQSKRLLRLKVHNTRNPKSMLVSSCFTLLLLSQPPWRSQNSNKRCPSGSCIQSEVRTATAVAISSSLQGPWTSNSEVDRGLIWNNGPDDL